MHVPHQNGNLSALRRNNCCYNSARSTSNNIRDDRKKPNSRNFIKRRLMPCVAVNMNFNRMTSNIDEGLRNAANMMKGIPIPTSKDTAASTHHRLQATSTHTSPNRGTIVNIMRLTIVASPKTDFNIYVRCKSGVLGSHP